MLQLHVWGEGGRISVISPECLASLWLLLSLDIPYEIVTSSNTNVSTINKLPVLIEDTVKYQGYEEISAYLIEKYPSSRVVGSSDLSKKEQLVNLALLNINLHKIEYIHQYNLYINTRNYEKYTRKQFQKYFPFPMMYNQPLKFYNNAQAQVALLGLNTKGGGFFNFTGQTSELAQTEYINDDADEPDQVAISTLHERQLITKSKEKMALKESKNSLRCLVLINEYLQHYIRIFAKRNAEDGSDFGPIFDTTKFSSSELLLYAYIYSLTFEELPDTFLQNYLHLKHPEVLDFIKVQIGTFNKILYSGEKIRGPVADEVPSLWNEIKYLSGYLQV
ncbi:uncharacterized protein CANTADRAFT_91524 [Suhomyces tanzawaensis NRRL Y-17324]|uniref:Mitochondrial outer membrane transport complex Sam37/metaxin N-terminal domain-containing protein n=1 Tax=Suhomyces tanzawaensis NRRL Y-17324 TaxID=984487 RepID=A0A1E4SF29_9ASCO|nr:uncharacterized protein CANTADRAFT_91524 [Suhomyces tanzawaensis NRRL Y-17324]ODV78093.1 hypothetical protein CANTADRAFT_91524 [Suhomyces tanzawaensis NRRL Y-17324]